MLIERCTKGASSVEVQYVINVNLAAHHPVLLRKIQVSQDIFSLLVADDLFSGSQISTIRQIQNRLGEILLGHALPASRGEIYADELVHITDNGHSKEYWWSRSCGVLAPITLPTAQRITPIWSGNTDYQKLSF